MTSESPVPIACRLTGPDFERRAAEVGRLLEAAEERRELEDGYGWRYPATPEWSARLLDFILTERHCCPFLGFDLHWEPAAGPLWLHLRGREGARAWLAGLSPCE